MFPFSSIMTHMRTWNMGWGCCCRHVISTAVDRIYDHWQHISAAFDVLRSALIHLSRAQSLSLNDRIRLCIRTCFVDDQRWQRQDFDFDQSLRERWFRATNAIVNGARDSADFIVFYFLYISRLLKMQLGGKNRWTIAQLHACDCSRVKGEQNKHRLRDLRGATRVGEWEPVRMFGKEEMQGRNFFVIQPRAGINKLSNILLLFCFFSGITKKLVEKKGLRVS